MMQYPGTDFHDLNLDWLLSEMKRLTQEWLSEQDSIEDQFTQIRSEWSDMETDWDNTLQTIDGKLLQMDQLYTYITTYFANLNIQEQVNTAFAAFVSSGDFYTMFLPSVQGQAASTATTWLNEHITQETGYVLDDTLTIAAAAAQAKATGNIINDVKITYFPVNIAFGVTMTNGKYVNYQTGNLVNSSTAASTALIDVSGLSSITYLRITATGDPKWGLAFYDAEETFISGVRCRINQPAAGYEMSTIDVPTEDAGGDPVTVKYVRFTIYSTTATSFKNPPVLYDTAKFNKSLPGQFKTLNDNTTSAVSEMQSTVSGLDSTVTTLSTKQTVISNHLKPIEFPAAEEMPLDIAHRGMSDPDWPENTIVTYKHAIENGWKYLETDIRMTSDGVWVLLHDATINNVARNPDGTSLSETIAISSITYEQCLQYDFGIKWGSQFAGTKIATLDELMCLCKLNGCVPVIGIKSSDWTDEQLQTAVDIGEKYGMMWHSFWGCSSIGGVHLFRTDPRYKHVPLGLTASSDWVWVDPANFESVSMYGEQYLTGENKVIFYRLYSAFPADETHTSKEIQDNFIDCCHANGLLAGAYSPTGTIGISSLSPRFDAVMTENYKYSDVQTGIVPTQNPT